MSCSLCSCRLLPRAGVLERPPRARAWCRAPEARGRPSRAGGLGKETPGAGQALNVSVQRVASASRPCRPSCLLVPPAVAARVVQIRGPLSAGGTACAVAPGQPKCSLTVRDPRRVLLQKAVTAARGCGSPWL